MFEVGDYIIYGSLGVCKVEKIGPMDLDGVPKDKKFYTLSNVYTKGSKVFTPVENNKVFMRAVISKEEACELVDHLNEIDSILVPDEKHREEIYKEAMKSCDCKEWVRIIKTLYEKKQSRIAEGKKVSTSDDKYLKMAQENLYGELSISLQMEKDQVEEYIVSRVEQRD